MLPDIHCCRLVLYYSLCDRALTNALTDGQQGALCVLAGPELGQEPVVVRQSASISRSMIMMTYVPCTYFCSVYSTYSLGLVCISCYHVFYAFCITLNAKLCLNFSIHPYMADHSTPPTYRRTRGITSLRAPQLLILPHYTFCPAFFLPQSPSIVTLVIVLLMHNDKPANRYASLRE